MLDSSTLPPGARVLAASDRLILYHLWEAAYISTGEARLYVGDHYGDPQCGLIDWNGRWCMTGGGSGLILCRLGDWESLTGEVDLSASWCQVRHFADGEEIWPVLMSQIDGDTVRFVQDLATDMVGIYDLDVVSLAIRKV